MKIRLRAADRPQNVTKCEASAFPLRGFAGKRLFFDVRKIPGLKKKPSTSELIDWLKLLMADNIPEEILKNRDATKAIPPLYGALLKNEQDVHMLERLAFMTRREGR